VSIDLFYTNCKLHIRTVKLAYMLGALPTAAARHHMKAARLRPAPPTIFTARLVRLHTAPLNSLVTESFYIDPSTFHLHFSEN